MGTPQKQKSAVALWAQTQPELRLETAQQPSARKNVTVHDLDRGGRSRNLRWGRRRRGAATRKSSQAGKTGRIHDRRAKRVVRKRQLGVGVCKLFLSVSNLSCRLSYLLSFRQTSRSQPPSCFRSSASFASIDLASSAICNCLLHLLLFLCHTLPHIVRFVLLLLKKSLFQLGSSALLPAVGYALDCLLLAMLFCVLTRLRHFVQLSELLVDLLLVVVQVLRLCAFSVTSCCHWLFWLWFCLCSLYSGVAYSSTTLW